MSGVRDTPDWFARAIAAPRVSRSIDVEGCSIHYQRWQGEGTPGILFIPGNGAHAHWWDCIAPFFAGRHAVAALDLSGTGDSGHRSHYSLERFAREAVAVCEHAGLGQDTMIVGHSFGGYAAIQAALAYPERVRAIVLIDSPVYPPGERPERNPERSPIRPRRTYPDYETACARFRLMPPQPCDHDVLIDYIARHSVQRVEDGWTWKFDDRLYERMDLPDLSSRLRGVRSRVAIVYGEQSELCTPAIVEHVTRSCGDHPLVVAMPEAHHHVILDRPLETVAVLRTLLAMWSGRSE